MRVSVVIPAYNEEHYLLRTLEALRHATANIEPIETIVVDNGSTDATREIAAGHGAKIIDEPVRNIGQVRNTGASAAAGEIVVFLDADTIVADGVFEQIIAAMADKNCLGGSVAVEYEHPGNRPWMRFFMWLWTFLGRFTKMRQGALQFCRADVFRELGGYDTTIFVGEDVEFHWRLDKLAKKQGALTAFVAAPRVITSSRRWNKMGLWRMVFFTHPVTIFVGWRIRSLWKDWYENAVR